MALRSDRISKKGLSKHIDGGRELQNGRGWREFKHYLEQGDEFGQPITVTRLTVAFNRSRPTILKWIQAYCDRRGVPYPDDLRDLMKQN